MDENKISSSSCLLRLKEWFTIPDTARYLSTLFGEDVSEQDVLHFALYGRLKLSVNIVNGVTAKCGKFVDDKNSVKEHRKYFRKEIATFKAKELGDTPAGEKALSEAAKLPDGCKFPSNISAVDDEHLFVHDGSEKFLEGIWDLPLLGDERLPVEQKYHKLTSGPEITLYPWDNIYFEGQDGQFYQLVNGDGCLPSDAVMVVRSKALIEFQKNLTNQAQETKSLDARAERTYLNIIGALLETVTGTYKEKNFSSETQLRDFLSQKFDGFRGVTPRTLAEKFALAKKSLNGELD